VQKAKLILSILMFTLCLGPVMAEEASTNYVVDKVLHLRVNSSINPATLSYFRTAYKKAEKEKYQMILIDMNTPGGLVTTTKDILTLIGDADFPTAIWIRPEGASATSAGAIISVGAHLLYMSNGTNIGAATPIQMTGDIEGKKETDEKKNKDNAKESTEAPKSVQKRLAEELKKNQKGAGGDARAKAINDLVALVESLAETRGRNTELFAQMIKKAASYKASEALKNNLIDATANTIDDIFSHMDGKTITVKGKRLVLSADSPQVENFDMDLGQKLLDIFANPSLAYLFFLIGAALIYLELQAPGGMIAGSIGAICLIFAGIGFQVLPLNFGALGLIVLAFLLFIMEIYIVSYGILSLAGIAALVSGSLFLFRGEDGYLAMDVTLVYSSVAAILIFMGIIVYIFIRDRNEAQDLDFNKLQGKNATIMSELPSEEEGYFYYQVKANGEIWRARSKTSKEIGEHIKIQKQTDDNNLLEF
jgi:membrane-bound serine protease (ClpP class)